MFYSDISMWSFSAFNEKVSGVKTNLKQQKTTTAMRRAVRDAPYPTLHINLRVSK